MFFPLASEAPRSWFPFTNIIIIAVNIAIFAVTAYQPNFQEILSTYGAVPRRPAVLSLITSAFLHVDIFHVLLNMWFLWVFGNKVEDKLGHFLYLFFYIAGGMFATVVYSLINLGSDIPVVGASGAVSAVLRFYAFVFSRYKIKVFYIIYFRPGLAMVSAPWLLGFFFFMNLLYSVLLLDKFDGVAYTAHVAGFLFGLVVSIISVAFSFMSRPQKYERAL
ncbi:MAG: rhomboid family intramembrane serine protease [Planctomycetota bacterium]